MKMCGRSRTLAYLALPALLLAVCALQPTAATAQMTSIGKSCAELAQYNYHMQDNLGAGLALIQCGLAQGGKPSPGTNGPLVPPNVMVSNRTCTSSSSCTKSENMVYASTANPLDIVVNYNDHNGGQYSGTSYSHDGGLTFTEIQPSPFGSGHGFNLGDPIVVFNTKLGKFYAGDLVGSCGFQGIGLWTSTDGQTWTTGACVHNGSADDRESMWVDNEPTSGTYGRMYISWNDFAVGVGALSVTHSDDGVVWSTPVRVENGSTFTRDVQITGSPAGASRYEGSNSTVFIAGMDEGGGGCNTRLNLMYKSLDGGQTWTKNVMGARFASICDALCSSNSYFAQVNPIWRHMGWGEPAVGPNGVVHYVYAGKGTANSDPGNIYYTRSTDNGVTWSTGVKINFGPDAQFAEQWMPSLSADAAGGVTISWYDRFKSTTKCTAVTDPGCNYYRVARQSKDNGVTFSKSVQVSQLINEPAQPDSGVVNCYAGDYDYDTTLNGSAFITWTDGRRVVGTTHVQDVDFAKIAIP